MDQKSAWEVAIPRARAQLGRLVDDVAGGAAFGWGGPPGAVLDAGLVGQFEIVTSPTRPSPRSWF